MRAGTRVAIDRIVREHVCESVNTALRGCTLKERWHGDVNEWRIDVAQLKLIADGIMGPVKGKATAEASLAFDEPEAI